MEAERGSPAFTTTHWTVVLQARGDSPAATDSLARLCAAYYYPLYAFVRQRGKGREEAEDLTQEFFLRLCSGNLLEKVHPAKGKFRSFLLAALKNFLANEWDKANAQKRGGGCVVLSLDEDYEGRYQLEPVDNASPDKLFERRWAMAVLEQTYEQVRQEMGERADRFEALKPALMGEPVDESYREIAAKLNASEGAVKVAVHRLRQKFAHTLRQIIAETLEDPREVEDELRYLIKVVQ